MWSQEFKVYIVYLFLSPTKKTLLYYWVPRLDLTQETEERAESAALASAANSAHFSVSCATSCLVTQYVIVVHIQMLYAMS